MSALPGVLKIFVTTGCRGCKRALELAEWLRGVEPRLEVQVMDLSVEPDAGGNLVFAVPTYVYGDEAIQFDEKKQSGYGPAARVLRGQQAGAPELHGHPERLDRGRD